MYNTKLFHDKPPVADRRPAWRVARFFLFAFFLILFFTNADAQYFKPVWVNDIGGTGDSKATNIAADHKGHIYVSGYIRGTVTFNLREGGTVKLSSVGNADIYIAEYDIATGNYIWAKSFGGPGIDLTNSMTLDSHGNVLITGQFQSTANFNPGGSYNLTSNGADDIFIAKYSSTGNFIWARSFGGGDIDRGHYITVDNEDNVFITASYTGAINVSPNSTYNLPNQGTLACFFAKYDSNGNLVWAHPLGNVNQQNLTAIAVDKSTDDVVVTGDFSGTVDFSYSGKTAATFNSPSIANFVARYSNGGVYKWVKYLPGSGSGIISSLHIDSKSNIDITGSFGGQFYSDGPTGTPLTATGSSDILVASYTSSGSLRWAQHYGSSSSNNLSSRYITTDANDNIYITGYFSGTVNIDPNLSNGILSASPGANAVFIAGISSSGKPLAAGALGGNCSSNYGYEIAADGSDVYVAGSFCSTADFDTGNCFTDNVTAINYNSDSFLAAFSIASPISSIITAFSIPEEIAPASIDQTNFKIAVTVAPGSNLKALTPTVTVSNGGSLNPVSGVTTDFSSPVSYTVNGSCSTVSYTVTVTKAVAKTLNICSGQQITLNGDILATTPDSYTWQIFQNGSWTNAPGADNNPNYQTSSFKNSTPSVITYRVRREISIGGVISYDSFYDVSVSAALSNNSITAPTVTAFCSSGTPAAITGSTPTGGDGTYLYQWQSSTDNTSFTDISGATAINYTPATINATTYFRREVTSGVCTTPATSNVVTIAILAPLANNTISAPVVSTLCSGDAAASITGSTPTGGDGTYAYQWQSSSDNNTFTAISGATAKNYTPGSLTATMYYRREVTSSACSTPSVSNVITITVLPLISGNRITTPAVTTFCSGGTPGVISGSTPAGGNGSYTYQWQSSKDNINFTDIVGATTENYTPSLITSTTYFRRTVTSGPCTTPVISNVVTVQVNSSPATPVPDAPIVTICSGLTATLSVSSPQQSLTYNWYDSPAKSNLLYSGPTYTTPVLTAGATFYVEAANGTCISPAMASVQVIVNAPPAAPAVSATQVSVCDGSTASLSVAGPKPGYQYNWYTSASGGSAVYTGTNFTTPAITATVTYYAEAASGTGCVSGTRTAVTVADHPLPQLSAQNVSVCPGSTASLTASSADANAVITWYDTSSGGSALATGGSFTTPVLNSDATYYAEAIDNSTGCLSASRIAVTVKTLQPLSAPIVTVGTITATSVTFNWNAVTGSVGYQVSINNGQTFSDPSSGNNGLSHTISGLQPGQSVTIIVRAIGSQACALSASSSAVTAIAVNPSANLIYVPNAFTPNGDGINDEVHVHSESINSMKFFVYDQWGELIFSSTDKQIGWDGTYKGTREPAGVYVYYVQAVMKDGQKMTKKGTITLLR